MWLPSTQLGFRPAQIRPIVARPAPGSLAYITLNVNTGTPTVTVWADPSHTSQFAPGTFTDGHNFFVANAQPDTSLSETSTLDILDANGNPVRSYQFSFTTDGVIGHATTYGYTPPGGSPTLTAFNGVRLTRNSGTGGCSVWVFYTTGAMNIISV